MNIDEDGSDYDLHILRITDLSSESKDMKELYKTLEQQLKPESDKYRQLLVIIEKPNEFQKDITDYLEDEIWKYARTHELSLLNKIYPHDYHMIWINLNKRLQETKQFGNELDNVINQLKQINLNEWQLGEDLKEIKYTPRRKKLIKKLQTQEEITSTLLDFSYEDQIQTIQTHHDDLENPKLLEKLFDSYSQEFDGE